ncbi:MAG: hypothetical protein HYR73_08720 [Candidatus Eisenbacteria bacterium]|nr:hypothetical protein [Candidatus Eisenbacteria bacterium]
MRKPKPADAQLLLQLYEIRRDPELRRARQWFLTDFKPGAWAEIKARYLSHSDEDRWFRMTISYWQMVGTLLHQGVLHPDLFFEHTGEDIVTWEKCRGWIGDARADGRPTFLIRFEQMADAHVAFRAKAAADLARAASRPRRASARRKR